MWDGRTWCGRMRWRPGQEDEDAQAGEVLCGVAFVFEQWSVPLAYESVMGPAREYRTRVHALDGFLARLAAGTGVERVGLRIEHDRSRELCSTFDGSLKLWRSGRALMFRVTNPKAVRAARALTSHREVSAGFDWSRTDGGLRSVNVVEATIDEISLVRSGACRGTFTAFL